MPPKKRTIKFYTVEKKEWDSEDISAAQELQDVIEYIKGLAKIDRKGKLSKTKVCIIERISALTDGAHSIMFKSAKTEYRPPLLDRETITERDNPKRRTEGDSEKTHMVIKYTDDDVFIILEKNGRGITINAAIKYLTRFTRKYLQSKGETMKFSLIPMAMAKTNFIQEIKKLNRVVLGEVYVEKSILGSDALNFSNRTQTVRHDVVLNLKAERQESIVGAIEDIYNKISGNPVIKKIRVTGKSRQNGGDVVIDTSFIQKVENIEADINELTGEINTQSILTQLKDIAEAL